jgi:hypothetical protein
LEHVSPNTAPTDLDLRKRGYVDGGAIGQCHHGADTGGRHQTPTHRIISDDGQQTAMQDDDLFAERPPNNKQWFDQNGQVRQVLDQLLDPSLELRSRLGRLASSSFNVGIARNEKGDCGSGTPVGRDHAPHLG